MKALARSAIGCALALATSGIAQASVSPSPSLQILSLPPALANVCEADPQALQQTITRTLQPIANAIDQWTQLVRSFSCDLSGSKDLGWHRVPLRAYESAIRYPLTWVETESRSPRPRRLLRTYYSATQLPQKIEFWLDGRIDEIRYDRRLRRLEARFAASDTRRATSPPPQCVSTTLQFRQQNGLWLLSGVEIHC